jgi:hypothetical protein
VHAAYNKACPAQVCCLEITGSTSLSSMAMNAHQAEPAKRSYLAQPSSVRASDHFVKTHLFTYPYHHHTVRCRCITSRCRDRPSRCTIRPSCYHRPTRTISVKSIFQLKIRNRTHQIYKKRTPIPRPCISGGINKAQLNLAFVLYDSSKKPIGQN